MSRFWSMLTGVLDRSLGGPLADLVVERERIAREIARIESEIAKLKSPQAAA
jgi:hypothetical protein